MGRSRATGGPADTGQVGMGENALCLELLLKARPWPALEAASGECLVGRGGAITEQTPRNS